MNIRPILSRHNLPKRLTALLWLAAWAAMASGEPAPAGGYHHRFQNAEHWAKIFDGQERDRWQKPGLVLDKLRLKPGAKVADIGAGTGYFAARLAKQVPEGRVYAIDIEPDMVSFLEHRAEKDGLKNITAVLASEDSPRIPEPVDLIFVCDTYHHIGNRPQYFQRLHASLLPGGRIVIVDFYKDKPTQEGPPPQFRVDPAQAVKEMEEAGFHLIRRDDTLEYQYILFFETQDGPTSIRNQPGKP